MPLFGSNPPAIVRPADDDIIERLRTGISQLETSNGRNLAHVPEEDGIHAGTTAGGTMGIMPNSLRDFIKQSDNRQIPVPADVRALGQTPDVNISESLKQNRDIDKTAQEMALRLMLQKTGGNEADTVYAWRKGHNRDFNDPEVQKQVQESPYVQKYFQNLRGKLGQGPQ